MTFQNSELEPAGAFDPGTRDLDLVVLEALRHQDVNPVQGTVTGLRIGLVSVSRMPGMTSRAVRPSTSKSNAIGTKNRIEHARNDHAEDMEWRAFV